MAKDFGCPCGVCALCSGEEPYPDEVRVTFEGPPIPIRDYDYRATLARFNGDEVQPEGWGRTEREAVADLRSQLAEFAH
jgi:hypothetical protein